MADSKPSSNSSRTHQILSATYNSPTNAPFTHTTKLPTPATTAPKDRTAYLSSLKAAVADLQDDINTDLTSRMEEDKAREASANGTSRSKAKGVDESKEEDNYGEEVVEED
ncbi:uncharacterized protein LY89DRAFT_153390 [Mollisia scopiformis]|uniref:EKC/KEOPS complex subunit GON7 n=1 Tax=Mollisia scopiformis TaxID=149040 RepID=A0A194WYX3_MOLSC|nr:uncharacterized protein LY89DRAFT_153390 [Mollisia scopiformis]KUJ13150.1 hypothetical protein LY89DRAFT_153390 [Mollisia scopiformis]